MLLIRIFIKKRSIYKFSAKKGTGNKPSAMHQIKWKDAFKASQESTKP
jgi:hypothetical protein